MAFLWTGSQIPVYLFGMINCSSMYYLGSLTRSQQEVFLPTFMGLLAVRIAGFGL